MKAAVISLVVMVVVVMMVAVGEGQDIQKSEGQEREADCSSFSAMLPGCPRNFAAVCGSDGREYPNECTLCAHNLENSASVRVSHDGAC
ncbi:trypsin inhibitor ClTI-1-like [Petromyzon marinus]|uniref:trypsin inhibitor ClTI-1-like n=1 Tax=Petromyzon marinus TaxID=7757 RepID=UPI003F70D8A7